ncbi:MULTISPECIES: FecCD family ABC transporter permease [Marinobacter]|jgi:iron complex transport system permease protein|uniref:Iron ABC transporter permease n=1 Tax=Marinobacter vinifirmus TaxID=355591 RepID=A0A558B993_9GAMM|nr:MULTISPECIES: iron ABC transporter permease [Marinobacter]KRW80794.1 ABC transporter permease [Marinobacter sp. P4B1]MCE0758273.1 iron ABC transporter permease [Marinobacter sp. G11]TVT33064.1 MAG: iron ABC transporter permease [Marinobacter vinifirmus]HBM49395.1 iron ABC transporter permease [Marinobacter sp.]|tara:strand:+ start:591 stop:1580 length:990 start_codon:yes stop_codon:yes gene_type:complete
MPDKRTTLANSSLLVLLLLAVITSLSMGTVQVPPPDVLQALMGNADPMTAFVVNELRLSRVVAGLLSGAALAMAGCLMQTLARNRLATPGIIGIDNAATAFAVASVVGVGLSLAPSAMALAGAACATAIAFGLAGANGTRGYRFIVAGIGIGAIAGAVTQVMLSRVAIDAANAAYPWTVGSLNARSGNSVLVLAIGLAAGYAILMLISRALNTLQFSDAVAIALGTRLKATRILGLALSVLLTGLAVSVCGPVGLIALLAPELARTICRPGKVPLTASALAGATFMVAADLLGRTLFSPLEIPVGIITAIVGSPYLLWILLKPSRRSLT